MSDCLVLGPEGAGKTLLIRKLQEHCSKKAKRKTPDPAEREKAPLANQQTHYTVPTVGANFAQMKLAKGVICKLRESGGQMVSLWPNAYKECKMVIYVIDSSNRVQVSAATVLLLDLLSSAYLRGKPVLLFFNKTDSPLGLGLVQYKSVMRLDDIIAHATQEVKVIDGSCWNGEGVADVVEWLLQRCS